MPVDESYPSFEVPVKRHRGEPGHTRDTGTGTACPPKTQLGHPFWEGVAMGPQWGVRSRYEHEKSQPRTGRDWTGVRSSELTAVIL